MDGLDLIKKQETFLKEIDTSLTHSGMRTISIQYAPAFNVWMSYAEQHLRDIYTVISVKDLLTVDVFPAVRPSHFSLRDIFQSIFSFLLGIIPHVGIALSGIYTIVDIAQKSYHYNLSKSEIQALKNALGMHTKPKKRVRKLKYIVFVPDLSEMSDQEQNYIGLLEQLIREKYIVTTALIVCSRLDMPAMPKSEWQYILPLPDEIITNLSECCAVKADSIGSILNIVGIQHWSNLHEILKTTGKSINLVEALVDKMLDKALEDNNVSRDEFCHFLKLCSLLFEPFFQKDIEDNYPAKTLSSEALVELALASQVLQKISGHLIYSFIEYFIRDYFRNCNKYVFPTETYWALFEYLKLHYPYQYSDIAILSSYIGRPSTETISYAIVAWYHEHDTITQNVKERLRQILSETQYLALFDRYEDLLQHYDLELLRSCRIMLDGLPYSELSEEAKCACLNLIASIVLEVGLGQELFPTILDIYLGIFESWQIFSCGVENRTEYIVDALLLSVDVELSPRHRNTLERLSHLIVHAKNLPHNIQLRVWRLGSILFSAPENLHYTRMAYEQSENYPYEHIFSAINYSAALLCNAQYSEAKSVLESCKEPSQLNSNTRLSLQNNLIIAKALSGTIRKSSTRKEFEHMFQVVKQHDFSDSLIVQNNYAASILFCGVKSRQAEAEKILLKIVHNDDAYHRFFAFHNLMSLYCITGKREEFLWLKQNIQVPYALRKYNDFFLTKFNIFEKEFDTCQTMEQLTEATHDLPELYPEINTNYYRLPILWGVIERWFE